MTTIEGWCDVDNCPTLICNGPHHEHVCNGGDRVTMHVNNGPCGLCGFKLADATPPPAIPDEDHTWDIIEEAYSKADGITVLGWADDMVLDAVKDRTMRVEFGVRSFPDSPCGHEDQVLVIAIRVPHPDEKSLAEIILGCDCCDLDGTHRHTDQCVHPCCPGWDMG